MLEVPAVAALVEAVCELLFRELELLSRELLVRYLQCTDNCEETLIIRISKSRF